MLFHLRNHGNQDSLKKPHIPIRLLFYSPFMMVLNHSPLPRCFILPGQPQHVIQRDAILWRGNDKSG